MTHPLVTQLRFSRSELQRALDGINDEDARQRFKPLRSMKLTLNTIENMSISYKDTSFLAACF